MNEDIERLKMVSNKMANTIMEAFKQRFPVDTPDSRTIMVNALMLSLGATISRFEKDMRWRVNDMVIDFFSGIEDEELHEQDI